VLRIPKLPGPAVGDAGKSAAPRRTPVGGKNRLPDDQHAEIGVAIAAQKLTDCGGPPQAEGSSGRNEQDETGSGRGLIKSRSEFGSVCITECDERLLPFGNVRRKPQPARKESEPRGQKGNCKDGASLHLFISSSWLGTGEESVREEPRNLLGKEDHDGDDSDADPEQRNAEGAGAEGALARTALLPESKTKQSDGDPQEPWAERVCECARSRESQCGCCAQGKTTSE
jgi:hypothetical protein